MTIKVPPFGNASFVANDVVGYFSLSANVDSTGTVLGGTYSWVAESATLGILAGSTFMSGNVLSVEFGKACSACTPTFLFLANVDSMDPTLEATVGPVASLIIQDIGVPYPGFDEFFLNPWNSSFGPGEFPESNPDVYGSPDHIIAVDVKPGGNPNAINPKSKGLIAVAILTTDIFDAQTVDNTTVAFGPAGATVGEHSIGIEDVDADGDLDLLLHFQNQETGIVCGDTRVWLSGQTFDGTRIVGLDRVVTVGCNN
jgi:hypothetical protein